jgi:hypothetical protein
VTDKEWAEEQALAKDLRSPILQVVGKGNGNRAVSVLAVDPYLVKQNPALGASLDCARVEVMEHHMDVGRVHLFVVAVVEAKPW